MLILGLLALLALVFLPDGSDAGRWVPGRLLAASALVAGSLLTALLARALLILTSAWLELLAAQARALDRLADAVDRLSVSTAPIPLRVKTEAEAKPEPESEPARDGAPSGPPTDPIERVRVAIREGHWAEAESLIEGLAATRPGPEVDHLAGTFAAARGASITHIRARIDAARQANDLDAVLDQRAELMALIPIDELAALDRDLARWCMAQIQKRLRGGRMSIDVALLSGRVAEALNHTPEGASLKAALPTLRRSVGLCAVAANPTAAWPTPAPPASSRHRAPGPPTARSPPRRNPSPTTSTPMPTPISSSNPIPIPVSVSIESAAVRGRTSWPSFRVDFEFVRTNAPLPRRRHVHITDTTVPRGIRAHRGAGHAPERTSLLP